MLLKKINPDRFTKKALKSILLLLIAVLVTNLFVDPSYQWFSNKFINFKRKSFDERVIKTNYLANINNNYDALLIGNSRSTYLDARNFDLNVSIFNYSVGAMSVYEYEDVIENFIELTGKEPKVILIGIDPYNYKGDEIGKLKNLLHESTSYIHKIKSLLSIDTFKFSLIAIRNTVQEKFRLKNRKQSYYDNDLVKGNKRQNTFSNQRYIKVSENAPYNVDFELLDEYRRLKNKYHHIKFIVYCLPFHADLIKQMQTDIAFYEKNEKYIKGLIDIFDTIYYFNYVNNHNITYTNFYDPVHFYPYLGDIIIEGFNNLYHHKQANFGYLINNNNYKNFIK